MKTDLSKCLSDAADIIENSKYLAKLTFYAAEPEVGIVAYCTIGAIRAACPNLCDLGTETIYDEPVAKLLGFQHLDHVFRWNDASERTKEEVVKRLRRGAEKAKDETQQEI